ncbi:MAG: response regulator transcription factor [Flavobacteriaceae bacterium]
MKTTTLKIIAIDNDVAFHDTYYQYFKSYFNYSLEGIYTSVEDALEEFDWVRPDLILSEVNLPEGISGIEGIKLYKEKNPDVKVIMVSNQNDFDGIKKAFKAQANGYLTKPVTKKRLLRALNSIRDEGAALSSDIAKMIISMFQKKSYRIFSERENQIIEHLGQGATYKSIAEKLYVTPSTINFHIQNIYLKLDVNSKSEALQKLRELDFAS